MIELIFVACLQTSPSVCEEKSMQYAEQMTPMACSMAAQPELARWTEAHPGWNVTRWKCQQVRAGGFHI